MNTPKIITRQQELADFVMGLKTKPGIALDTEFMRVTTYFPVLCLVQLSAEGVLVCVDPLSIADLSPLAELLSCREQEKILHSYR